MGNMCAYDSVIKYKNLCKLYYLFLESIILFSVSACGNSSQQKQAETIESASIAQPQVAADAKFPFPEIPTMLTQPEERKAYLIAHYWDNFNFADTALVNNRNVAEQGAADYLAILADGTLTEEQVKGSLDGF